MRHIHQKSRHPPTRLHHVTTQKTTTRKITAVKSLKAYTNNFYGEATYFRPEDKGMFLRNVNSHLQNYNVNPHDYSLKVFK
jgi:hypothetical protein